MEDNKKFWDRFAFLYTRMQGDGTSGLYKDVNDEIAKFLKQGDKVLELACGTGQQSFVLGPKVSSYIATDFSTKMIERCKEKDSPVEFMVADATNLEFSDESFDVVIIANALHVMPSPDKALSEIKRVLKKDGLLIAPTFVYEGKVNKFKLKVLDIAGFKQYNKFTKKDYEDFISVNGFKVVESKLIKYNLLPECIVVAKK